VRPLRVETRAPAETHALAAAIAGIVRAGDVLLLSGDLGAGKTVFAGGLAAGLGVDERVVSPTFTIVREYRGRLPLVHVDVYRLESVRELEDLGLDEIVRDDAVAVIEWGDTVAALFPEWLEVRFELATGGAEVDDVRVLELGARGASWSERADALAGIAGGVGASRPGS
jgi:tRNA threonylcarbamoyladenosine biosynthesis protein TsaE